MKAVLLAAGCGTRLKPLTDSIPKCLVKVAGKPLLAWWFELLRLHRVNEVLINVHHHHEQVIEYGQRHSDGLSICFSYEPQLLGSAGTLRANREFIGVDDPCFVLYADNLTNTDLTAFLAFHRRMPYDFSVAVERSNELAGKGVADVKDEILVAFQEKPAQPQGEFINAGMYIVTGKCLNLIADKIPADIGYDLLPKMAGSANAWVMNNFLIDIGTHESLQHANEQWPGLTTIGGQYLS